MFPLIAHLLAFLILSAAMAVAYWVFVRPHRLRLDIQQAGEVFLVLLALTGGLIGAPFWWADERASFAWDVPALASRMLASAGWSFAVAGALALRRPTFRRMRLMILLLFIYLVPLVAAIVLFHLGRFDPTAAITYSFFAVAIVLSVGSTWYLLRPARPLIPDAPRDRTHAAPLLRGWLALVALVTGLWGLALFLTDKGPSPLIWVWPGDPLSSELIGVMLLTIAGGALYSRRTADTARVMLAMIVTYSLGLAAASAWNSLAGKPIKLSYLVAFGAICLGSLAVALVRDQAPDPGAMQEKLPAKNS